MGISLSVDRVVAATSSFGTLLAALATFLTISEMRAGRIESARARVTSRGTDHPFSFELNLLPSMRLEIPSPGRIILKNASQGVARNIHVEWEIVDRVSSTEIDELNRVMPHNFSFEIDSTGFLVLLKCKGTILSKMPVNGRESEFAGDLGSSQEHFLDVPQTIVNYAFIKWLILLSKSQSAGFVDAKAIPTFKLRFSHDSPYESNLRDEHIVRFLVSKCVFRDGRRRNLSGLWPSSWNALTIVLAMEFTSREIEALPTVII